MSIELLSKAKIEAELSAPVRAIMAGIEVHAALDSTNAELLRRAPEDYTGPLLCLAEEQTSGRGRQGRSWYSPPGANLYWSLLWRFPQTPAELLGLSALTAIGAAQALRQLGAIEASLKWPNDILWDGRKLAGILLESSSASAHTSIVAGIGLNVFMPEDSPIDQAWTDLHQALGQTLSRNTVAATLLNAIVPLYQQAAQGQWPDLPAGWTQFDTCQNKTVQLHTPQQTLQGVVRGIDQNGALILETARETRTFTSGEISLVRPV